MTIYFTASVTGKKKYEQNYRKIVETLKDLGHDVINEHIFEVNIEDLIEETAQERAKHHKDLNKWLNKADLVVAEVSFPSVSVGYEVALALDKSKPVLALYEESNVPVALLGETSDKFIIDSYNLEDLKRNLNIMIEELVQQMDTRFNFFISPKHQNYLDWIAKNRKIPRSVFLRDLIEQHMEENEEYNG